MTFDPPWQYSFPPFFTIQPVEATRAKQIEDWCGLVLNYCRVKRLFILDTGEAQESELFYNKSINRKLPSAGISLVLDSLVKRGRAEWSDPKKRRVLIYWKRPEEWAASIHRWIEATGRQKTVCTFYELRSGPDTTKEEFHDLDEAIFMKALKILEHEGKGELMGDEGIKFF